MRSLGPILLVGCAPDLSKQLDDGDDPGPVHDGPGVLIDATDEEIAVHWDIDAGELVDASDPAWDLSFRRYEIRVNGGVSGDGTVEGVVLDGVAYDELVDVPADGWITDAPDGDGDQLDDLVFFTWYDYDYETHTLSPADRVYALRSGEALVYRIGFLGYYDDAGTPAMITFEYDGLPVEAE